MCSSHLHNTDGASITNTAVACLKGLFVNYCFLCLGKGYSSRASGLNQSDLLLSGGSVGQLAIGGGAGGVYLPDYSVRQLTDLQVLKVTKINPRTTYVELCALIFLQVQSSFKRISFEKVEGKQLHHSASSLRLILEFQNRQTLPVLQPLPLICPNPRF